MPRKQSRRLIGLTVCGLWCVMNPLAHAQPPDPSPLPPAQIKTVTMEEAHELVGGPTLITLNFDNAMPQAVYEELFRQAGISPHISSADFWTQYKTPVTVHFERKPFWEAMRELESQAGLTVYSHHGNGGYALVNAEEAHQNSYALRGPSLMSGSFQIVASQRRRVSPLSNPSPDDAEQGTSSNEGGPRALSLHIKSDPKFDWSRAVDVQVESAVDENGTSLLASVAVPNFAALTTIPPAVRVDILRPGGKSRDKDGANTSRKIARLKGKIRMVFVSASETWEVLDPLNSPPATKEIFLPAGREEYSIQNLEVDDKLLRVNYTVTRQKPEEQGPNWLRSDRQSRRPLVRNEVLFKTVTSSMSLVSADGAVYESRGGVGGGPVDNWDYTALFYYPESAKDHPPAKLVWKIPLEWKIVEVPFEFTDLPMP